MYIYIKGYIYIKATLNVNIYVSINDDMSSRRLQDMSLRSLQGIFSVPIFPLPRRLQDVLKTYLQDVFKTSWKTKNRYTEDVLNPPSRRLQDQQMFAG